MQAFDPTILEQFANQLLKKADSVRVGSAVTGGVVGVIFGAVPLTPLASVWPIPAIFGFATILLGALAGVLVGYVVGEGRAFRLRVQAQTALFQVDIERRLESALAVQARLIAAAIGAANPTAARPPAPVAAAPVAAAPRAGSRARSSAARARRRAAAGRSGSSPAAAHAPRGSGPAAAAAASCRRPAALRAGHSAAVR